MRQKKVWRYYCDYCKKAGCHAGYLRTHEKHCTANPNRECGMCLMIEDAEQKPLAELTAVFDGFSGPCSGLVTPKLRAVWADHDARIKELETLTNGCPACMLATARALGKRNPPVEINVEFKKRVKNFWSDRHEDDECYADAQEEFAASGGRHWPEY